MQFPITRYSRIEAPKSPSKIVPSSAEKEGQTGELSDPKIRGAGDILARVLRPMVWGLDSVLGTALEDCDECKARRQRLNRLFPIGQGSKKGLAEGVQEAEKGG